MGQEQGNSRQEQRDGSDRLRSAGDAHQRASEVREDSSGPGRGPKMEGKEQASKEAQKAETARDPEGSTTGTHPPTDSSKENEATEGSQARTYGGSSKSSRAKQTKALDKSEAESHGRRSGRKTLPRSLTSKEEADIKAALDKLELVENEWKTGRMMLAILHVGTADADQLAKITGYSRDFVRIRVKRLRAQKVLVGPKVFRVEWFDEDWKISSVSFVLDVLVAEGLVDRMPTPDEEQCRWQASNPTEATGSRFA
jgi:hypothetical protein